MAIDTLDSVTAADHYPEAVAKRVPVRDERSAFAVVRPDGSYTVYRDLYPGLFEPFEGHSTRLLWW